jgi:hypothetical protein
MRILMLYRVRNASEESTARVNALFAKWQPEMEIGEFNIFSDGTGGMGIIETDDPAMVQRMTGPWAPFLDFELKMLVPIDQSVANDQQTMAFWDSVS